MIFSELMTTKMQISFLLAAGLLLSGCDKLSDQRDHGWTSPIVVTSSKDSLVGGVNPYKWHNAIIVLQGLDDGTARCFLMNRDSNSWSEVHITGVPQGYFWANPAVDQANDRIFFEQGYMENEHLVMDILIGHMIVAGSITVQNAEKETWITDKKSIFGDTPPTVKLNDHPGKRNWPSLGSGLIEGSDMYIPYCINGITVTTHSKDSPFNSGVFHSSDSGKTWRMEKISDRGVEGIYLRKTSGYYYYFGGIYPLWFTRKAADAGKWEEPKTITKTLSMYGDFDVASDGDTVHLCWMDRRHNKWRFNIDAPPIENDDIVYCHRKDSDSRWSKNIDLSKGVLYCYAPSISVEGNNVVVAWAGIQNAGKYHTDYNPNDIYYVISKDGGNTWTKPLKVIDGAKDGMTAGHPQVMLLNGVIHLFYIQGKMNLQQLSPGLTKLNQPPWPIYYTQRPFPD